MSSEGWQNIPLANAAIIFVILGCSTLLYILYRLLKIGDKSVTQYYFDTLPKTVEEIPKHYYFSKWMPKVVEGLWACFLLRQGGARALHDLAASCGLIFETTMFTKRITVVTDATLVQKIIGSNSPHVLPKARTFYDFVFVDILRYGMLSVEPDVWHKHRKITSRLFASHLMTSFLTKINKHASTLVSAGDEIAGGENVETLLSSNKIKIVAEFIVGENSRSERDSEIFHHLTRRITKIINYRTIHRPENSIAPIWRLNPKRKEFNKHIQCLHDIIGEDIQNIAKKVEQHRKLGVVSDKSGRSLVEEMLLSNCTVKEVTDEVGTFFMAGHETSLAAMYIFLQMMAENPEHLKTCQDEIDSVFSAKSGSDPVDHFLSMDDLSQLKFLEMCIMEELRLMPPVPIVLRELSGPLQIDDFNFRKDTIFLFSSYAIQRDPRYFPDPEKFDPYRWLPEKVKQRPTCTFFAFSHGPRNCLAFKMAINELKIILAWLLSAYDIHTTDKLDKMKFLFDATLFPERELNLKLKRRITSPHSHMQIVNKKV